MKDRNPADLLKRTLASKTGMDSDDTHNDFDIIDVIPIPMHGDRMVRLRTLEEALNDFEQSGDPSESGARTMGYFVQIKPKRSEARTPSPSQSADHLLGTASLQAPAASPAPSQAGVSAQSNAAAPERASSPEGIYLGDGKLNLPFLIQSAELLFSNGDYALARNIYKAILSSGEKPSQARLGLAHCYEAEGRLEEARINYEESIAYHPQPEAYKALTALLIRQKKDQQAAETIERALHHRQLDASLRYELHKVAGNCWGRLKSLKDAERHYHKALEIRPDADEIRTNLGVVYLDCGRTEEALRHFEDAVAANPKSHQAMSGLGACALAEGNKTAAHAWFARSLQIELKNPTAIFHLVKCAYSIKNYGVAAKVLEDYIQVAPINVHLLYSLAGLQFHLGRIADTRETCIRIHQLEPGHAGAAELLQRIEALSLGDA